MTRRMAVLDDWEHDAATAVDWSVLPDVDLTIFTDHVSEHAELVDRLRPFEIVMLMRERTPMPADVVAALPQLRLLVTTGMRNRAVDVAAARASGVVVCGTDGLQWAAPELTWALIMALCRQVPRADASMRAGRWEPTVGMDLHGSTLGLLGLGRLGGQVATVARAFAMNLVAWSPHLTEERAAAHGARLVGKKELFARSDIVSVHLILADSTRGLVGEAELAAMKPTAYLVNTSRGPIVDQDALLAALRDRRIAGAGLDVYDEEPLPAGHPLRTVGRTVLTPHLGYVTRTTFTSFYGQAVEDVRAYVDGSPIRVLE
ncbi:MAG TPA: D-2-hydroxyacid dehydrogenase family protein [Pseudonocardiaceae bacterium]|jgi:phosphoglycerate dehydrogenase-like enzyme|nr:D-2-hydroxyacid dehydrogenase family protein [Pseudonocardiaceae bacterium]